jgi:proline iminopeptidase
MDKETRSDATPPFEEARIDGGDGHLPWHAQFGKPDGIALFWLHGGPGSGASLRHAQLIDCTRYRLVLPEQRGCGRSLPAGELRGNSLEHLIADIERLRLHLGLSRILLGGGSWGATLALCYAAQYPDAVSGLVLRSPFLAESAEITRLFQPLDEDDAGWRAFAGLAPQGADLLSHAAQELQRDTPQARALARAWHRHAQMRETGRADVSAPPDDAALLIRYRIQSHYLRRQCFLDDGAVLAAASGLPPMPVAIFHGSEDRICSPDNARRLAARMPGSALSIVEGAGHDPFHPGMASALNDALRRHAAQGNFTGWGDTHVAA